MQWLSSKGVLPPKLVLDLEEKLIPAIQNQTENVQEMTKAWLDSIFAASGAFVTSKLIYNYCC